MVAGKVTAVCGHFHAKEVIILSKLLLEFIRTVPFVIIKQYCLHQKLTSRLHLIQILFSRRLRTVATGHN